MRATQLELTEEKNYTRSIRELFSFLQALEIEQALTKEKKRKEQIAKSLIYYPTFIFLYIS